MLLTVGDSFTAKRWDDDRPWPEILSFNMGMPLLNLAREGMSNEFIFRNFVYGISLNPGITHVVIGLSNWDRLELGAKSKYTEWNSATKTMKKSIKHSEKLLDVYNAYFSSKYYIDCTIGWIRAIIDLCENKGIKLVITQLVKPLWFYEKNTERQEIKTYLEKHELLKTIDKKYICRFSLDPSDLAINHDKNSIWWKFTSKYMQEVGKSEYCIGFHKYSDTIFDLHPNFKGHSMIAKEMYNGFNR